MTTTLIARSLLGRANTELVASVAAAHVCASVHPAGAVMTISPAAAATPTVDAVPATNLWLGGDEQGSGFGSKYATKRITPGHLEGMT